MAANPQIINVTARYQLTITFGLVMYTLSSLGYVILLVFMWGVDFSSELT